MAAPAELVGPFPPGVDESQYDRLRRRVMWTMPTGLYLLGSKDGDVRNFMTCNLVTQVSFEPKLVGVAVENHAKSLELIVSARSFSLSILHREDKAVVRKFVKPAEDDRAAMTLNGYRYQDAPVSGSPLYAGAYAYLDCFLFATNTYTSHTLLVGEVVDAGFTGDEEGEVLRMEDTRMNYGG